MAGQKSDSDVPAGFKFHRIYKLNDLMHPVSFDLYLPIQVKAALDDEEKQERAQRREAREKDKGDEDQKVLKPDVGIGVLSDLGANVADRDASTTSPAPKKKIAGQDYDPAAMHPVYSAESPAKLFEKSRLLQTERDLARRDESLSRRLAKAGVLREVGISAGTLDALLALRACQPHFGAVVDLIHDQVLLARRTGKALRIPPILLDGEPGVGKTHFAIELGKALGTTVRRVSFDSAITGATLTGSERRWSNTEFGVLFELICLGQHANPIVILDEIDKAEIRRECDPLAPLHTLLEPGTATQVRDISVDFEFDASLVTWIATSNFKLRLAASLRSRFREFHIQRPDAEGALALANAVIAKVSSDLNVPGLKPPGRDVAVLLAHLTAREIRQATEQAIATAVTKGRSRVTPDDLPPALRTKEGHPASSKDKTWLH